MGLSALHMAALIRNEAMLNALNEWGALLPHQQPDHATRAHTPCEPRVCVHAHIHVLTTCACAWAHRWTPFQHNSTTHNATPQDLLDATNFAIQTPEVKVKVWGKDGKAELLDGMSFAKRCRCSCTQCVCVHVYIYIYI